jgi:hypothetical protein
MCEFSKVGLVTVIINGLRVDSRSYIDILDDYCLLQMKELPAIIRDSIPRHCPKCRTISASFAWRSAQIPFVRHGKHFLSGSRLISSHGLLDGRGYLVGTMQGVSQST